MRRVVTIAALACAVSATAHPLGNFTTNRQARLEIAPGMLRVRYVVDMAELPTFRAMTAIDTNGDGTADETERATWARGIARDVAHDLHVTLDGHDLRLASTRAAAATQPGAGGLPTLRTEIDLEAALDAPRGTLVVRDDDFAGLPGWQDLIAVPAAGVTLGASSAAAVDRTDALRAYPADVLAAPPQRREAHIAFAPGAAVLAATAGPSTRRSGAERFGDRLTALVADDTPLSPMIVLGALMVAAALGALHALTPGHGKTIVGAYLVGSRGTWKHAVFLGLVVTATHTAGVYALGAATLAASAWILPERLLPWLSAASGLLVVAVGSSLVRERLATALHGHTHHDGHHHDHGHDHDHAHGHDHAPPPDVAPTLRNLVALGVSGGLLPCPSALVVMLGAIALGRTAFGLALILAFSVGLAAVLTAIGLVLVHARGLFERLPLDGRFARFAPAASAAIISLAGLAMLVEALAQIGA